MPGKSDNIETKLADAALRLAGKKGWNAVTFDLIAKEAKVPVTRLRSVCRDKGAVLVAIVKIIDQRTAKALGKPDKRSSYQDRLFEALMARFDILQEHRAGIMAIIEDGIRNPAVGRSLLPAHCRSMRQILSWSGVSMGGSENMFMIMGLLGIYYRTIWYWKKDSSADMNRTMATLDQGLRYADKALALLFRGRQA